MFADSRINAAGELNALLLRAADDIDAIRNRFAALGSP